MFDRIFADYLVKTGRLSDQDVEVVFSAKEERRARLGVIAVSEKLMSVEQAEEINQLQAVYDRRFGDIAVDNGFLTQEQVERLIDLQGNSFLAFVQAVVDQGFLTMDEVNHALEQYQRERSLTLGDLERLKSCEIENIVPIFLYRQPKLIIALCGIILRTFYRLVDYRVFIKQPYIATEVPFSHMSMQELFGEHTVLHAVCGSKEVLQKTAVGFAGAAYINNEEDCLDALCELVNCINGMYATRMSAKNVELDLRVPDYRLEAGTLTGESLLCIPVIVFDQELTIVLSLDTAYSI